MLALRHPDYFKYTLAVSFANKSAQEMKDRIIRYLGEFAKGDSGLLGVEIQEALSINENELQEKSKEVLTRILHQYGQFSISTIDAFFQRVIRSFTRESGLLGNFRLEVENDRVLEEVIAQVIDGLGPDNPLLTDWVVHFSRERLADGKDWNISEALKQFSKEIFKESYKSIEDEIQEAHERIPLADFLNTLRNEKRVYLTTLKGWADEALEILKKNGIETNDFNNKESGTALKYFKEFSRGARPEVRSRIIESSADPDWGAKKSPRKVLLKQLAETRLRPLLNQMLDYDKINHIRFITASLVEKNFYSFGLLLAITGKLRQYKTDNNIMLLSDASHFLNGIISQNDTPFIYEKVGSFYRHYLIDEFQDTSGLQWSNFKPLVRESLDQNNRSLVVGDVKQSIYRWRGGDLGLLQQTVEAEIGSDQTEKFTLKENWRSAEYIVDFNNRIFSYAAPAVSKLAGHDLPQEAFQDVFQVASKFKERGFVQIEFLEKPKDKEDGDFQDHALKKIPGVLEQLQSMGIPPGNITILVRKNKEGQRIADFLMRHKNSDNAVPGVRYDVVSNESLRLDAASSVLLLLSALRYLNNPDDAIARAELVMGVADLKAALTSTSNERRLHGAGKKNLQVFLPEEFILRTSWLVKLSLVELTETLIRIFQLGDDRTEVAYMQSFQDVVLEFGGKDKNDIGSFLTWWDQIKDERSIQVASTTEAVNIFTIHKAKGLQFKYVVVPFCNWSMDHERSSIMWVKSDQSPYDQVGYLPVQYEAKLEKSFFAGNYEEEFARTSLENLNILYVACTRAEEGLIIIAPAPSDREAREMKIGDTGALLYEAITRSPELQKDFHDASKKYSKGTIGRLSDISPEGSYPPAALEIFLSVDWRKRLVIRRDGREFFEDEKSFQRKRVNYGILMHTVLSRIQYSGEVDSVIQKLNFEGLIIDEERGPLVEKIKAIVNHNVAENWFGKEWTVRTETPIILPNGRIARLDRVVSKEVTKGVAKRKAIVIDYKTGEKKIADREQVEEYTGILSAMGFVDVEGYLFYLDSLEVVRVIDKMNLTLNL